MGKIGLPQQKWVRWGNGTQAKQHEQLWGPATHSPKNKTQIICPGWKPFLWPPPLQVRLSFLIKIVISKAGETEGTFFQFFWKLKHAKFGISLFLKYQ